MGEDTPDDPDFDRINCSDAPGGSDSEECKVLEWEIGLPNEEELTPLSQSLIPPELALALSILPCRVRSLLDVHRASHRTISKLRRIAPSSATTDALQSFHPFPSSPSGAAAENYSDPMIFEKGKTLNVKEGEAVFSSSKISATVVGTMEVPSRTVAGIVEADTAAGIVEADTAAEIVEVDTAAGIVEADTAAEIVEVNTAAGIVEADTAAEIVEVDTAAGIVEADTAAEIVEVDTAAGIMEVDTVVRTEETGISALRVENNVDAIEEDETEEVDASTLRLGNSNDSSRKLKRRMVWTPQLHKRFLDVVGHIGFHNAVPKTVMQLMNVEGLSRENVASHLQKYRIYLKRLEGLSKKGPSSSEQLFGSTLLPHSFHEQQVPVPMPPIPMPIPYGMPGMPGMQGMPRIPGMYPMPIYDICQGHGSNIPVNNHPDTRLLQGFKFHPFYGAFR